CSFNDDRRRIGSSFSYCIFEIVLQRGCRRSASTRLQPETYRASFVDSDKLGTCTAGTQLKLRLAEGLCDARFQIKRMESIKKQPPDGVFTSHLVNNCLAVVAR